MQDYYKDLNVKPDASHEDIKKSFRKLALKHHPDRGGTDACDDKFKKINQAYSTLSDPKKRQEYDLRKANPGGFGGFKNQGGFRDVWSEFFGDFDDIFGNRQPKAKPRAEPRVRLDISISDLESGELVQEFSRNFDVECDGCAGAGGKNPEKCHTCNGTGQVGVVHQVGTMRIQNIADCPQCTGRGKNFSSPCQKCNARGFLRKSKKYKVTINTEVIS